MLRKSYTAADIAAALGVTERGVRKMADTNGWKYTWKKSRGPACRTYLFSTLPEEIRIKIARHTASGGGVVSPSPVVAPGADAALLSGVGARAGAFLGASRAADLAESAERIRLNRERGIVNFAQLPEQRQAEANARLEVLQARDAFCKAARLPLKRGSQSFANEYVAGHLRLPKWVTEIIGESLSWSSLNRWQQSYDDAGLAGLANGYKAPNKGTTTLTPAHQDLIKGLLKDHPHIRLEKIEEALEARFSGQTIPHISSIRRFTKGWKAKHESLLLYMANPDMWKNKRMIALGDASEQVNRLNQVWQFDSTPADVMLADGRFCLIGVLDVFSRRAKLLVSPSSRATAVAALTRRAILDWGVPEIAKTDNGSDYVSRHMVRVFEALEIEQILCPPFTPESKPHIERFFHTFSHDIMELMPGYIGHNVTDRKAIEARRSFADRLMKRGGDPVEINQLTAAQLQDLCDRWCRAMYEQNPHAGLKGQTPAQVAREWTGGIRRVHDERALDMLLSEAPGDGGLRTVQKDGIRCDGTTYISADLPEVGTKVRVLLDASDYGTIHLYDAETRAFVCTAVDPARTGHDRSEIAARAKNRQKELMRAGAKELKRNAKEQATDEIHMEILRHREGQIAELIEFPHRSEEHTTPALVEAGRAVIGRQQAKEDHDGLGVWAQDLEKWRGELAEERQAEAVKIKQEEASGIVRMPFFATSYDRYQWLRDRVKIHGKSLAQADCSWLEEFYQSAAGRAVQDMEGDLRPAVGAGEAGSLTGV